MAARLGPDRDPPPFPRALRDAGATACDGPRAVAERAGVAITVVPDTPDVEAVLFGPARSALYRSGREPRDVDPRT